MVSTAKALAGVTETDYVRVEPAPGLRSLVAAETFPDDVLWVKALPPLDPNYATGQTGRVYIYNAQRVAGAPIKKPILFIDGFDALNRTGFVQLYYFMQKDKLLDTLRDRGYDVLILDPDAGGDLVQRNAMLLAEAIRQVNARKQTKEPLVVVGPSMGGLIARYALAYMEKNAIDYDTRLFITFDSPFNGLNPNLADSDGVLDADEIVQINNALIVIINSLLLN